MASVKQVWRNFKAFWKSQVLWATVAAVILLAWQYHKGLLNGSIRDNLWNIIVPYIGIASLFVLLNTGHAIIRAEWRTLKKLEHEEHREDRQAAIERRKPPVHKPNLRFRRVYQDRVFVGHEVSGNSYNAWFAEIGNELSDREIGSAKEIRAHITYSEKNGNVLHTLCPGRWGTYQPQPEANIKQGEGCVLILAYDRGHWFSDLSDGVRLPEKSRFMVRLIDPHGNDLLNESLIFEFHTWGGESNCKKI